MSSMDPSTDTHLASSLDPDSSHTAASADAPYLLSSVSTQAPSKYRPFSTIGEARHFAPAPFTLSSAPSSGPSATSSTARSSSSCTSLPHSISEPAHLADVPCIPPSRIRQLRLHRISDVQGIANPRVSVRVSSRYSKRSRPSSSSTSLTDPSIQPDSSNSPAPIASSSTLTLEVAPTRQNDDHIPRAKGALQFQPQSSSSNAMSEYGKRASALGGLSVAERSKLFQGDKSQALSTANVRAAPRKLNNRLPSPSTLRGTPPTSFKPTSFTLSPAPSSSSAGLSSSAPASDSSVTAAHKAAPRITVPTPCHRRARSDVSVLDPFLSQESQDITHNSTEKVSKVAECSPPTIRTSSVLGLDEMVDQLELNRPGSQAISTMRRTRNRHRNRSASLMQSITEERGLTLNTSSSMETLRKTPLGSVLPRVVEQTPLVHSHDSFQVSPSLSEDGAADWHGFVSGNYGVRASLPFKQAISIVDLAFPVSKKSVYESKLCKPDSPTLNDEATWLEEELARCSSSSSSSSSEGEEEDEDDDDEDNFNTLDTFGVGRSTDEEFMTPIGSPASAILDLPSPPSTQLLGLGIEQAVSLAEAQMPDRSADCLLEQVVMHERCMEALNTLSRDEMEQAVSVAISRSRQSPVRSKMDSSDSDQLSKPHGGKSLAASAEERTPIRKVSSSGDFASTQGDTSGLFTDDSYDTAVFKEGVVGARTEPKRSLSIGSVGRGHGGVAGERRTSALSYTSTDSTASADYSVLSHGSSLLFNSHLHAPMMDRGASADTAYSTRPSSIASSYCNERSSIKPPRSPMRMNALPLPPLPQEAVETPQLSQGVKKEEGQDDSDKKSNKSTKSSKSSKSNKSVSSKASARMLRQANRRREGTERPLPPARMGSLEAMVAAAPKHEQLKEEFPDRLLGDWMSSNQFDCDAEAVDEVTHSEASITVEPLPANRRIYNQDGTMYLPGLGEIVPASPDVTNGAALGLDINSAAWKRLGEVNARDAISDTISTKNSRRTDLRSKLSSRLLGFQKEAGSSVGSDSGHHTSLERSASRMEVSRASYAPRASTVLERFRKSSAQYNRKDSMSSNAAAELPAAWQERMSGNRPSLDVRSVSFASHANASSSSVALSDEGRTRSSLGFLKMFSHHSSGAGSGGLGPSSTEEQAQRNMLLIGDERRSSMTLEALAASTFESPKGKGAEAAGMNARQQRRLANAANRHNKYQSFFELSDDEESESTYRHSVENASAASSCAFSAADLSPTMTPRQARKDLTKLFGASEIDLSGTGKMNEKGAAPSAATKEKWTSSLGRSSARKRSVLW